MNRYFIIQGRYYKENCFPSLNNLISEAERHPMSYNRTKKKYEQITIMAIRQYLKGWKATGRIKLHFEFGEKSKGAKRDFDNISGAGRKIVIDGLTKSGTIEDDAPKYLAPSTESFVYTDGVPYIKVTIEELDTDLGENPYQE